MSDLENKTLKVEEHPGDAAVSNSSKNLTEISKTMTEGFLCIYQNPLQHIRNELNDLISKQEKCIMQTQLENKKLCDVQEDIELQDMFSTIEIYQKKLLSIKKDIMNIHEKTFKLKKRALKFQQLKQKEANQQEIKLAKSNN